VGAQVGAAGVGCVGLGCCGFKCCCILIQMTQHVVRSAVVAGSCGCSSVVIVEVQHSVRAENV
jgi:hypothetical protein